MDVIFDVSRIFLSRAPRRVRRPLEAVRHRPRPWPAPFRARFSVYPRREARLRGVCAPRPPRRALNECPRPPSVACAIPPARARGARCRRAAALPVRPTAFRARRRALSTTRGLIALLRDRLELRAQLLKEDLPLSQQLFELRHLGWLRIGRRWRRCRFGDGGYSAHFLPLLLFETFTGPRPTGSANGSPLVPFWSNAVKYLICGLLLKRAIPPSNGVPAGMVSFGKLYAKNDRAWNVSCIRGGMEDSPK